MSACPVWTMFMEEYFGLMVEFSAGMRSSISSIMGSVVAGLELVMAVAETEECFPPQAASSIRGNNKAKRWNRRIVSGFSGLPSSQALICSSLSEKYVKKNCKWITRHR